MNKYILLMFGIFLISLTTAMDCDGTFLGNYKINSNIELRQTCDTCTYVTLNSITYPNSTILNINANMTKSEIDYNYSFSTGLIGEYSYSVFGDKDGTLTSEVFCFEVTTNGKTPADGIVVVAFTILFIGVFFFGLLYFFKALGHVIQLDMDLIDTIVLIGSYLSMWIFYYFSYEYLGNSFINEILEMAITIGAFTHVLLPLIGFMVSFIMTNLRFKQKARITY